MTGQHRDLVYVIHIDQRIARIEEIVSTGREEFLSSHILQDAETLEPVAAGLHGHGRRLLRISSSLAERLYEVLTAVQNRYDFYPVSHQLVHDSVVFHDQFPH